jgi:poly(A) polymerase
MPIREIWDMQERLPRRSGKRADLLLDNPRFRAGYDFLLLRESAGEQTDGLGEWWTDYQDANDSQRREMIKELSSKGEATGDGPKKRRRSSGSKRKRSAGDASSASGE